MTGDPRVVLLDYGSGNLRSAERALTRAGAAVEVTADRGAAMEADGLVVPGVGAFAACMEGLLAVRGPEIIGRRLAGARPVLGICVGHQVLFESGIEHGDETAGCGEWPGHVERLNATVLPHIGWNTVQVPDESVMFAGVERERFYFVHSYARTAVGTRRHPPHASAPGQLDGVPGRPIRRGRGERAAVGDPVPSRKVGGCGSRSAVQLGPTVMSTRTRQRRTRPTRRAGSALAALAAVILAVGMTGCGSEDSGDSADSGDSSPTVSESSPAPSDPSTEPGEDSQAVAVSYRKTGGLKPVDVRMTYSEDGQPPDGVSAEEVDQVLAAASDPALREAELEPMPKNTCCDRQEYTVLVTYADGTSETFRTLDGLQQPAVFEDLLGMLG